MCDFVSGAASESTLPVTAVTTTDSLLAPAPTTA